MAAAGMLAACAAVTAVLATPFAGRGKLGLLDSVMDPRFHALQARFPPVVNWLPDLGTLKPVTLMTIALVLACMATRRWSGAILATVAEPAATGLTEYVLKPSIGQVMWWGTSHSYPSGHATGMFALAAICAVLLLNPPGHRLPRVIRLLLVFIALLLAAAVAAAMVAIGAHTFTDAVGGAAVGTGVVMACALAIDLVMVPRSGRWAARGRGRPAVDLDNNATAVGDDLAGGDQEAGGSRGVVNDIAGLPPGYIGKTTRRFVAHRCLRATRETLGCLGRRQRGRARLLLTAPSRSVIFFSPRCPAAR